MVDCMLNGLLLLLLLLLHVFVCAIDNRLARRS